MRLKDALIHITEKVIDASAKTANAKKAHEAQTEAQILGLINAAPAEISKAQATAQIYLARSSSTVQPWETV